MQNVSIIVHGRHGLNALLKDFIALYKDDSKIRIHLKTTKKEGDAHAFAADAVQGRHQVIIAAGGDGTVNGVLNGMFSVELSHPKLLIVPIGTGNDFMKTRRKFTTGQQVYDAIISTKSTLIDVGQIQEKEQKHYFLNIADAGFGGETVHTLNRHRKYIGGKIAYPLAILRTFLIYRKAEIAFSCDHFSYQGKVFMLVFCNSSTFASGIIINPDADPTDGVLNITLLGKVSFLDYVRYLPKLKKGIKINHPELHYLTTKSAQMTLLSGKAPVEVDGETVNLKNINVLLIPSVLQLIEPSD